MSFLEDGKRGAMLAGRPPFQLRWVGFRGTGEEVWVRLCSIMVLSSWSFHTMSKKRRVKSNSNDWPCECTIISMQLRRPVSYSWAIAKGVTIFFFHTTWYQHLLQYSTIECMFVRPWGWNITCSLLKSILFNLVMSIEFFPKFCVLWFNTNWLAKMHLMTTVTTKLYSINNMLYNRPIYISKVYNGNIFLS